jgi:hypothetical protein
MDTGKKATLEAKKLVQSIAQDLKAKRSVQFQSTFECAYPNSVLRTNDIK